MNTTTNYGLKLYEGTDLFNPLTVENVNAGDIDKAMKAISDHSVGAATELTTGTVHAITRADTDRNVFLFVATSNFTAGDTFTLDGNQVSALTPDGQQLATGSYVIGSSVLCALHDTLITVYVNPAKAKDADMLDGHDSSYYATDSDLDTVAGTIGAISDKVGSAVLTTTAPDLSGAVNELNTHLYNIVPSSNVIDTRTPMMAYKQANTLHIVVNGTAINGTDYVVTPGLYKVFHFAGNPLGLTEGQEKPLGYCCGTDVITSNVSNVDISAVYTGGNTYIVSKLQTHWLSFHFVLAI